MLISIHFYLLRGPIEKVSRIDVVFLFVPRKVTVLSVFTEDSSSLLSMQSSLKSLVGILSRMTEGEPFLVKSRIILLEYSIFLGTSAMDMCVHFLDYSLTSM